MTAQLLRESVAPIEPPQPTETPILRSRGRGARFVRGRPGDPAWERPALLALLASTSLLYLWGLGASGWANSFYSAAVQAGTHSWKAFFFGSSDASNFITVDKSPAALWMMEIPARIFGVNSWSILVPQALEGVAAVGILYATVRRWFSPAAALLSGFVLALTPVAALMFRFNNPDALLVLLLTAGAYATVRALEHASTKWLMLAWSLIGFGFLAKMLQALLVVPAFAIVYLLAAPTTLRRRIVQLALATGALIVSAGWWVATVELWPKSSRPYIGGSQNNSVLNLIFGYNGFGRLTGDETGSVTGGGGNAQTGSRWGPTGLLRLFNTDFGGQISWLLPAALILLVAGLIWRGRAPRTDRIRAALIMWGGWLFVTGVAFSLGQGIIHAYYTVALGPAIGALVGIGGVSMWQHRDKWLARVVVSGSIAATAVWARVLLGRTPTWHPELRSFVLVGGLASALLVLVWPQSWRRGAIALGIVSAVVALAAPAAYSLSTAATAHTGAIPSAGPGGASRLGIGGGGARPQGAGTQGAFGAPAQGGLPTDGRAAGTDGRTAQTAPGAQARGGANGVGALLNGSTPSAELVAVLDANSSDYTWVAATIGANNASGYQLATDDPVMAIGGFNGSDPAPTLAQFQQFVSQGKIHFFIGGGNIGGSNGGSAAASAISAWVSANFTAQTVGGVTLYDLTA
jgi:4-amino-4-deoxy-L-arabinose transferase-like glycosyltransferase